ETVTDVCDVDSAGITVLERTGDKAILRWHAMTGRLTRWLWQTLPCDGSPCTEVIGRNTALMFARPDRIFPALCDYSPRIEAALLVPWTYRRRTAGALWAIAHTPRKFDAEDIRLLKNLADFVGAAWNIVHGRDVGEALAAKRAAELARTYEALE